MEMCEIYYQIILMLEEDIVAGIILDFVQGLACIEIYIDKSQ